MKRRHTKVPDTTKLAGGSAKTRNGGRSGAPNTCSCVCVCGGDANGAAAKPGKSRKAPVVDQQMRLVNAADAVIASLKGAAEAVVAHDAEAEERDSAMPQCQALLRLAAQDCPPLVRLCGGALGDAAIAAPFRTPAKRQRAGGAGHGDATSTPTPSSSGRRTPVARTPCTPSVVQSCASASPGTTWRSDATDQDEPWKKIWPLCPHLGAKGCRRLLTEFEAHRLDGGHKAYLQRNGSAKHRWMPVTKLTALCV